MSSVPCEIFDRIIDHLHDDGLSLRNCALVCQGWLPCARFHIFRMVLLDTNRHRRLNSLLESAPHVRHYIREVEFYEYDDTSASICSHLPNLTHIGIVWISVKDILTVLNAVSNIPFLKHLNLHAVDFPTESLSSATTTPLPKSIQVLEVYQVYFDVPAFMQWAVSVDLFPNVHTLTYTANLDYHGEDFPGLFTFLSFYASNLVYFGLYRLPLQDADNCFDAMSRLSRLRVLCLEPLLYDVDNEQEEAWLLIKIPELFHRITYWSTSITEVTVDLWRWAGWKASTHGDFDERFGEVWRDVVSAVKRNGRLTKVVLRMDDRLRHKETSYFSALTESQANVTLEWIR